MADETLPQARAILRGSQMSASKAREVLDLIRGKTAVAAMNTLMITERGAAEVVAKVLRSAVANAQHRYGIPPEELYVVATFADEGATLKRFRPRARGRAGRIRKRTCHITVVVERMPEDKLQAIREKQRAEATNRRARRVRSSRKSSVAEEAQAALEERTAETKADTAVQLENGEVTTENVEVDAVGVETVETPFEETPAGEIQSEKTDPAVVDAEEEKD